MSEKQKKGAVTPYPPGDDPSMRYPHAGGGPGYYTLSVLVETPEFGGWHWCHIKIVPFKGHIYKTDFKEGGLWAGQDHRYVVDLSQSRTEAEEASDAGPQ